MGASFGFGKTVAGVAALALLAACGDKDVVNVVPPVATTLSVVAASDAQTGVAGAALATPIAVKVMDQNGSAMANATVTWAVATGGGSVSSATSTTNASGEASTTWTLGTSAGAQSVTATLANNQSVTITATATAGAFTSLALVSGDAQSVAAGATSQPFVVRAVDANGNPVSGVAVTWAATGDGTLSATSGTTDASGLAQVTMTGGATPGAFTVTATSGTATPIVFNGTGT